MTKNINNTIINNQTFDLSLFSQDNITFLTDQVNNKNLFTIGYYHFFKLPLLELTVLKDFLQILDFNKAYIILPILATDTIKTDSGGPILSLSKQFLVTRDSDPITIRNFLLKQIEIACENYGIADLENYTVVLKFRPISLNTEAVQAIPQINYEIQETHIKKNVSLMNSKYYNGSIIPLSMNLELYGEKLNKILSMLYILKFDLKPSGFFFKVGEFVVYIYVDGLKHEGILFKEKSIFYKFEDVLIEGNSFVRTTDNYILHIDDFNISYFEKPSETNFISKVKNNTKLSNNIVTFDIETYVKDGKFIPFACGWYDGDFIQTYYLKDFK